MKISFQWIIDPNVKSKTSKVLEDEMGECHSIYHKSSVKILTTVKLRTSVCQIIPYICEKTSHKLGEEL